MEHLALEIFDREGTGRQYAALPEDANITITETSEIFDSGNVWSLSFTLNAVANAHIVGTAGEIHGSRIHDILHKRRARLWAEGLPLYLGYLVLADEVEVDGKGNFDVAIESGQHTFDEMIEGAKANQVPMMGDVQIGMALWRKRWTKFRVKLLASMDLGDYGTWKGDVTHGNGEEWFEFAYNGEDEGNSVQQYPRMVFPNGKFRETGLHELIEVDDNYINTDSPYDDSHPYCNVALCYQKYGYEKKDQNGVVKPDYSGEPEAQRGYEYMPANRVNSAPNFFVIYWLRALMKHLGIYIEENQMMGVEDLRRLFFVNTNCAYKEPVSLKGENLTRYGEYVSSGEGRLIPEYINSKQNIRIDESGFVGTNTKLLWGEGPVFAGDFTNKISIKIREVEKWQDADKRTYTYHNSYFHKAYATSECFPNVDISEVISAIENGFGVRLLFDDNYQRVRIVLLRNVFHSTDVQTIECEITDEDVKVENSIRGFRMTYGDSNDTHFYYKGFADKLPHKKPYFVDDSDKHDYSHWELNADYAKLIQKVSAFDKTCYVTPNTGNAYGIKIDKDAKRYDELHPSVLGFADFMDAEDGDCTGDEETIKTINVGFAPAIMNDLNMEAERGDGNNAPAPVQRFALFVDKTMRPRRFDFQDGKDYNDPSVVYDVDRLYEENAPTAEMTSGDGIVMPGSFAIASDMYATASGAQAEFYGPRAYVGAVSFDLEGHISEGYRLYLQDNYEPNDDGVSPVEQKDWGLTLGIMRGSGVDAYVNYSADPDDGEGNDTWDIIHGSSATAHPDTCDCYGNLFKYVGSENISAGVAASKFLELFPGSNASFDSVRSLGVEIFSIKSADGTYHAALVVTDYPPNNSSLEHVFRQQYIAYLSGHSASEIMALDKAGHGTYRNLIVELDSSQERRDTLRQLIRLSLGYTSDITVDNGVGSRYGRFSLKLRAEKPNPYYVKDSTDADKKDQYLKIENENLQGRGLADQFYKEYSYWIRNARIVKRTVKMELAQLLSIDKTKRVTVGDVTGFIRKMQYSVSNKTGLGMVTMEIMYI